MASSSGAYLTLAWNAAINGLPSVELPDIVVKHPTIASGPPPNDAPTDGTIAHDTSRFTASILPGTPVPQSGFLLLGEVDVFSTAVVGKLEKWMGPSPEDVIAGNDPPSIERVALPGDFRMSMLIPLLRGTPFENIIFRNVMIFHQNYAFDKTKSTGWHFSADWVIDSSCNLLYDILTKALQVDAPILRVHAALGQQLRWGDPLNIHSFILKGIFPDLTVSPSSELTLTSIEVRLLGIRGFSYSPEPHSTLSFGFGISGTMKLKVPGSVVPLNLEYEMGHSGTTANVNARIPDSAWEDALGVKGLRLEEVVFGTTFSATSPWKSPSFDVSATFTYMSSEAYLQGSYTADGNFSLEADLEPFGIDEINDIFFAIFSGPLTLPDFDVGIGSAVLSVVSGQGLSVSLLDVDAAGYTAASAKLTFSSSGASLSGALPSDAITFGDAELHDTSMRLSFWAPGEKDNVDLVLSGTLRADFLDPVVEAVAHLYPDGDEVEWAVVGELSKPNQLFTLSNVVPAVKDSFADFPLKSAVFIAASMDGSSISQSFPDYQVRQGVQVFGVIDRIPALNDLLRSDVQDLVLNASWSKASGFSLSVSLPAESTIDLGHDIKSTPITLAIRTNPIELVVATGVTVLVKDATPLDFSSVLAANTAGGSASEGWSVKPIATDNLKIGSEANLTIELVYGQLVSATTPSGFSAAGGAMTGSIEAFLRMNVNEDPERQILFGKLKKLGISDVVTFSRTLVQQDSPKIPDDLLNFEQGKVCLCPSGLALGHTSHPQGFSFKADMLLFEKKANVECTFDKAQKSVDIIGGIDEFELGPLSVRGPNGSAAKLECHVGPSESTQQLALDGFVTLFDDKAQTHIDIQLLPEPTLKFYLLLQFAHVFMYKLDATPLGSIHDRLSNADFSLHAELEKDILEYIAQQIIEQFKAAKVAVTDGLEVARAKVDETLKSWEAAVADAERKVEQARKEWESYERSIRGSNQPIIDRYHSEISRLQGEIDKAHKAYSTALDAAQRAVNQAQQDRGIALAAARRDIQNAKRDMERAIEEAQRNLVRAEEELSKAYGDAQGDIESAEREVQSIQDQIDNLKRTIDEYERAPWYEFWKKAAIPELWNMVRKLEAIKAVAVGALDAARAALTGAEYLSKVAAIDAARRALELARSTGEAALSAAEEALRVAEEASKVAVDQAEATLQGVKQGPEFVALQGAITALEVFKNANDAAYEAAKMAIEGLTDSVAFIALNAAKAALEVAKGSTKALDAAKEALSVAEKATENTLSILQKVDEFGAKAVIIESITLSGALRGLLGTGGGEARPLSASVKGYVVGRWFEIQVDYDPKKPVAFVTAIFEQLWNMLSNPPANEASDSQPEPSPAILSRTQTIDEMMQQMNYGPFPAARSKFLQERPDVLRMLVDQSASMPDNIPRGPFSGTPIVPPIVVARKALMLMQEERGVSVFDDLDE